MSQGGPATGRSQVDEGELHALVDGCLASDRQAAVLAHLLVDRADRERVDAYRRQLAELARIRCGLDRYAEGFAPELQRALADRLVRARRRRLAVRVATGLAAASVLAAAVLGLVSAWRPVPEAVTASLSEPELPVPEFPFGGGVGQRPAAPVEGDRERSLAWLAGHLRDQPLELPDLRGFGLSPVGGQVLDGGSSPAVRLAWADEFGQTIDLYVGVVSSEAEQAFTMVDEHHVSLHWRRGRLVFALVGPAGSSGLVQVMQGVMTAIGEGPGEPSGPAPAAGGPAPDTARPIRAVAEPVKAAPPVEPVAPSKPALEAPVPADKSKQL